MSERPWRKRIGCAYRRWLRKRLPRGDDGPDLASSAVVFAPHQDDEVLGCGGTLIKKKKAGARVTLVYMTDGRRSHGNLISGDELKTLREREALAAAARLGIGENDVIFLRFPDGKLSEDRKAAVERVMGILRDGEFDDVFVPYCHETPADHGATRTVVTAALGLLGRSITVYEYPVWFWCHWPWATPRVRGPREFAGAVRDGLLSPVRLLRDFRCGVYIGDVLEEKRCALERYTSQMARLVPDPQWMTLSDIANGEWLECFFQDYEIFRRSRMTC